MRIIRPHPSADNQSGYHQASEAWGNCGERLAALGKRIDAIPAVTVAGFAVKANALLYDMFLWEKGVGAEEEDYNERVLRKFIAAMRSAGGAS